MDNVTEREAVVARQDRVLRHAALIVRIRDFRERMSRRISEAHRLLNKDSKDG